MTRVTLQLNKWLPSTCSIWKNLIVITLRLAQTGAYHLASYGKQNSNISYHCIVSITQQRIRLGTATGGPEC